MISRRTFFLALPALSTAPRILAQGSRLPLRTLALNHVALSVSNPARSVEFYQQIFGMPVQARQGMTTILRIGDGPQFMAIEALAPGERPSINRIGIAVADFDVDRVVETLSASGVTAAETGVPAQRAMRVWTAMRGAETGGEETWELYLGDPNGIIVQIVDPTHCGGSGSLGNVCGAPETSPVPGLLAVRDLNHFTNYVAEPERSREFFQDVFGLPVQAYQASSPVLGVGNGPQFLMFGSPFGATVSPPTPGEGSINHVCMTVENFDSDMILATLADYGIRPRADGESPFEPLTHFISMRMPDRGGAPEGTPELYLTDPDGLRIQLQDTTYCGGGGALGSMCG